MSTSTRSNSSSQPILVPQQHPASNDDEELRASLESIEILNEFSKFTRRKCSVRNTTCNNSGRPSTVVGTGSVSSASSSVTTTSGQQTQYNNEKKVISNSQEMLDPSSFMSYSSMSNSGTELESSTLSLSDLEGVEHVTVQEYSSSPTTGFMEDFLCSSTNGNYEFKNSCQCCGVWDSPVELRKESDTSQLGEYWWKEELFEMDVSLSTNLLISRMSSEELPPSPYLSSPGLSVPSLSPTNSSNLSPCLLTPSSPNLSTVPVNEHEHCLEAFYLNRLSNAIKVKLDSKPLGPEVVAFVLSNLLLENIIHSRLGEMKSTLVHIAARHNRVDILDWLKNSCCDEGCVHNNESTGTVEHSESCKQRSWALWTCPDVNGVTPLCYACSGCSSGSSHDSCVFLLMQLQQQDENNSFIHQLDRFGNGALVSAFKKKDFALCDLLMLFGASVEGNHGPFAESLLHSAVKEFEISKVEYIAKHAPKLLLKKNQREDTPLFCFLKDYRSTQARSATITSGDYHKQGLSPVRNMVNKTAPKEQRSMFINQLLIGGCEMFGKELFEKALIAKNQHGRNILSDAVVFGDNTAIKAILQYLTLLFDNESLEVKKLVENIAFARDRNGKNILHLTVEFATKRMNKFNREDCQSWLESLCFLLTWLEDFMTQYKKSPPECERLFCEKDLTGVTAYEYIEQFEMESIEDKRWRNAVEMMKTFEFKLIAYRNMQETRANLIASIDTQQIKKSKGLLSFFSVSHMSTSASDEQLLPRASSERLNSSTSPSTPTTPTKSFSTIMRKISSKSLVNK